MGAAALPSVTQNLVGGGNVKGGGSEAPHFQKNCLLVGGEGGIQGFGNGGFGVGVRLRGITNLQRMNIGLSQCGDLGRIGSAEPFHKGGALCAFYGAFLHLPGENPGGGKDRGKDPPWQNLFPAGQQ